MTTLKKVTDDYFVVEKAATLSDLIDRAVSKVLRKKKKGRRTSPPSGPNRSRAREYERERSLRISRLKKKVCTACAKVRPAEGFRMCLNCRMKWRVYNARYRLKQVFSLTEYGLRNPLG